jgi:protein subunit release factor B
MDNKKHLLFSVTANDCEWSYTKGTGAGGQKRNKTSSAVHCHHRPSGAHGYSEASRSQLDNKREAFRKMAESKEFKTWHQLETNRRTGVAAEIDREVERQLTKVKHEVRVDGKWREVDPVNLVSDPDTFDVSKLKD